MFNKRVLTLSNRFLGQPKSPPSWYIDRGQSHIEAEFSKELGELADRIEAEHWFGDHVKSHRFRVDFLLKDARLIIELDGHQYHSTKEQLEKDAIRQRYLTRAGFTVIRFTGREINRNVAKCVEEVREIYQERIERAPSKYRVIYVDYVFFIRQMSKACEFYNNIYPEKKLSPKSLDIFLSHAIEWLNEKSFITVYVFHPPDISVPENIVGQIREYEKGEIRLNVISDGWYTMVLGEHLVDFSHLFDEYYLIGDDPVYVDPLREVLSDNLVSQRVGDNEFLSNGKLLRLNNDETSFVGLDLNRVRWQDVWYSIGTSMGLNEYEL